MSQISSETRSYINWLGFIDSLCNVLGTKAYLWGGWITDVYSGKILRNHDDAEHLVENIQIHAVAPEFQYILKLHPEFMNPQWKHREKDFADIKVLKSFVKSADLVELESQMQSI